MPPSFVKVMVFAEFVLFVCFGVVQTWGLYSKTKILLSTNSSDVANHRFPMKKRMSGSILSPGVQFSRVQTYASDEAAAREELFMKIETQCNYAYIILSFVAKTLLCWIVLSPILADAFH